MSFTTTESLFKRFGVNYIWFAGVTVLLGTTSMVLSATIVNVAVPDFMRDFAVEQTTAQWLASGFLAGMTVASPLAPWAISKMGMRMAYMLAVGLFLVASLIGAIATDVNVVIAARIIKGCAAGIIQPLGMITIFRVFPENRRGKAMAIYGLGIIMAPALGPSIGGYLVEYYGWRAVFYLAMPFCLLSFVMASFFLPKRDGEQHSVKEFDWIGLVLLVLFMIILLNGQNVYSGLFGIQLPVSLYWLSVCLFGVAFILWEKLNHNALLDINLFNNRQFAAATSVAFIYGFGIFGSTYLLPLFFQSVAGYSAFDAGLLLAPGGIVLGAAVFLSGRLTDLGMSHRVLMVGLLLFGLSFYLLSFCDDRTTALWFVIWVIMGRLGLGLIISALNAGAIQVLELTQVNQGSSVINFVRQLGGVFGVNLMANFLYWRNLAVSGDTSKPDALTQAFQNGFVLLSLVFVMTLIPAWLMGWKKT